MSNKKKTRKGRENNNVTVIIAVLGLLGTIITAYFTWRASSRPTEIIISATQTAEAKPTLSFTETPPPATPSPSPSPTPAYELQELTSIQFDYSDSPANHGWRFVEGYPSSIVFEKITDATVGNALSISAPPENYYAFDYDLPPNISEYGNLLDLTLSYRDERTSFYTYVRMTRGPAEAQTGWLKFKIGNDQAQPAQKTSGEQEWVLYVNPAKFLDNNWVNLRINLENAVQETYGRDGWKFDKLLMFRIRGNIGIDSMIIYARSIK